MTAAGPGPGVRALLAGERGMPAGAVEGDGDVAEQWTGGQPAVLCSVSGTEGSQ